MPQRSFALRNILVLEICSKRKAVNFSWVRLIVVNRRPRGPSRRINKRFRFADGGAFNMVSLRPGKLKHRGTTRIVVDDVGPVQIRKVYDRNFRIQIGNLSRRYRSKEHVTTGPR